MYKKVSVVKRSLQNLGEKDHRIRLTSKGPVS